MNEFGMNLLLVRFHNKQRCKYATNQYHMVKYRRKHKSKDISSHLKQSDSPVIALGWVKDFLLNLKYLVTLFATTLHQLISHEIRHIYIENLQSFETSRDYVRTKRRVLPCTICSGSRFYCHYFRPPTNRLKKRSLSWFYCFYLSMKTDALTKPIHT